MKEEGKWMLTLNTQAAAALSGVDVCACVCVRVFQHYTHMTSLDILIPQIALYLYFPGIKY